MYGAWGCLICPRCLKLILDLLKPWKSFYSVQQLHVYLSWRQTVYVWVWVMLFSIVEGWTLDHHKTMHHTRCWEVVLFVVEMISDSLIMHGLGVVGLWCTYFMTKKHFFLSSRLSLLNHKHTPGLSWSAGKVSYLPVKATAIGFKDLDVCPGLKYLPHVQDKPDFRRDGGGR